MPRGTRRGVLAVLAPIVAWAISLAGSYVLQDFVCSAVGSAGRAAPGSGLTLTLVVLNVAMLLVCIAAGVLAVVAGRAAGKEAGAGLARFLALFGVLSAFMFGYGVVLIAVTPLLYGPCQ
jgi:hypothetical protein